MRRPSVAEATAFLKALDEIRAPCVPVPDSDRDVSPPMVDLACLIREADLISDVETHLRTVCRMALRDVRMRCHLGWWTPRDFVRPEAYGWRSRTTETLRRWEWLADGDRNLPATRLNPEIVVLDIEWQCERTDMPTEVWLTGGEILVHMAQGMDGPMAIDAAFCARHATPVASYFTTTVASTGPDEGRD